MKQSSIKRSIARITILSLLLPAGMLTAQKADSKAVNNLLAEVKLHDDQAEDDASTLGTYARSNLHWQTHGTRLNQIKVHVNDLIQDSNQLTSLREEGSPWQQEAIDRISPLLPQMALHLTVTINHFNDHLNQIQMKPYHDYVRENQKLIHTAHAIISNLVDYAEAKARMDALEKDLQLSAPVSAGS
jgi:hypothetical protein